MLSYYRIIILSCYHVIIKGVPKKKSTDTQPQNSRGPQNKTQNCGFFCGPLKFWVFFCSAVSEIYETHKKNGPLWGFAFPLKFLGLFLYFPFLNCAAKKNPKFKGSAKKTQNLGFFLWNQTASGFFFAAHPLLSYFHMVI